LALQLGSLRALAVRGLAASPLISSLLLLASISYWAHGIVSVGTVAVDWVPWVASGGAAAIAGGRPAVVAARRGLHPLLAAAIFAVAAGGAATGAPSWIANQEALATRHAADNGQGPEAVAHGRRSVELDGGRGEYWNELGRGYFAEATFISNRALALTRLALAGDQSQGGTSAAIRTAEEATIVDPNNPEPKVALAEVAAALGDADTALRAIAAGSRLNTDVRYARLAIAVASSATDLASARRTLEELVTVNETAGLRISVAQVALRQGDRGAALVNAKRALELEPGNTTAQAILSSLGS